MLSSLGAVLKETVGPLAKAAAEDWCKDRLKQGANAVIAQSAPSAIRLRLAGPMALALTFTELWENRSARQVVLRIRPACLRAAANGAGMK